MNRARTPPGERGGGNRWGSLRWPLLALAVSVLLLAVAFALDTGGERARDKALLIGAPTLYILLPASIVWLLVAVALRARRATRARSGADGTTGSPR